MEQKLPAPARYFPIDKGVYEVAPGLKNLGQDLGNGARDALVFQLDTEFPRYRESKLACRSERLSKYLATHRYGPEVSSAVNRFLTERLVKEYPGFFSLTPAAKGSSVFRTELTGESFTLSEAFELTSAAKCTARPAYASAFDALCSQVQEDVAVMTAGEDGSNWLSAIHLCSPSHWAAEEKIGKTFFEIHAPVPGIEKLNQASKFFVDAMINKGPYVRFVWGFGTDRRLNHHPEAPVGWDSVKWKGRTFDPSSEMPFILRVERQVLFGLPEVRSSVFAIRVSFIDGEEIRANSKERELLKSGLLSMTPESRAYKGLSGCMDEVIDWLA